MHTTNFLQGTVGWVLLDTAQQRRDLFNLWYENHIESEGREPSVVTVHQVEDRWGGPEEGGWTYRCGYPIENIAIFSKEGAIEELSRLHHKYEAEEYEGEEYDICLANEWGKRYPVTRPHYE